MQESIIKRRDDAGGHYKGKRWCMRTLQKGRMVQKEGIITGRDDAGGRYKWEGSTRGIVHKEDSIKGGGGGIVQEDITEGRDGAEGEQYKREG